MLAGSRLILGVGILPLNSATGVAAPVAVTAAGRVVVAGHACGPIAAAVSTVIPALVSVQDLVVAGVAAAVGAGAAHGPVTG